MNLREQLKIIKRGVVEIIQEEELINKLKKNKPLNIKLGVDPTSPDIHLGHTVTLLKLKAFQELGHRIILIIGDYTALIGDPSGQKKMRPKLEYSEILKNSERYKEQVFKILDKDKTEIVYNGEWFSKMDFKSVIELASRMTLARMLEREDFQTRYREGNPIGIHELLYPLMQGYDSLMIDADVELGGTDQKFNILVGRELQKEKGKEPQVGILMPILTGTDGNLKMSKSYKNYIGISEDASSMYGKIMSIPDKLLFEYYELLTEEDLESIKQKLEDKNTNPLELKKRLAYLIVKKYAGEEEAKKAGEEFEKVFSKREIPSDIPEFLVSSEILKDGKIWLCRLATTAGIVKSNSEAKRLILQNAVEVDGEKISDINFELSFDSRKEYILKFGKRKFLKVKIKE